MTGGQGLSQTHLILTARESATAQSPGPSMVGKTESTAGAVLGDGLRESTLLVEYWLDWAEECPRPPRVTSIHEPVNVTLFENRTFADGHEGEVMLNSGGPFLCKRGSGRRLACGEKAA